MIKTALGITGALFIAGLAFSPEIRKEILRRDKWTCTNPDCIGIWMGIGPLDWGRGWNVQAAHEPELHQKQVDRNPNHGRCRCIACHLIEEVGRNNHGGANLLYTQHTIHNKQWLIEHNWHGENSVEKIPLKWFYDWVAAGDDAEAKQGLAEAFAERYLIYDLQNE